MKLKITLVTLGTQFCKIEEERRDHWNEWWWRVLYLLLVASDQLQSMKADRKAVRQAGHISRVSKWIDLKS